MISRGILCGLILSAVCVLPVAQPVATAGKSKVNFRLRATVDASRSTESYLKLRRAQGAHLGRCTGFCDQIALAPGICFGTMCLCSANGDEIAIFYVIGLNEDYIGNFQVVEGSGTGRLAGVRCQGLMEMIIDSRGNCQLELEGTWSR